MTTETKILLYPVAAEWDDVAKAWSLLSPDFPEIASVAKRRDDIAQQADDAIRTAVEARREDGEALPEPMAEPYLLSKDWPMVHQNMILHVPVRTPSPEPEPVRVNVSLDRALLERIDAEAGRRGMTRSGFLAEGARTMLRA